MRKRFNIIYDEKGQSIIIVSLALVVLLGFTALVSDVGYLYFQRRNMQNAADAAALAAAWELPDGNIQDAAEDYASLHKIENGVIATKINNGQEVKVEITNDHPLFFARIFGYDTSCIITSSIARKRTKWGGCSLLRPCRIIILIHIPVPVAKTIMSNLY